MSFSTADYLAQAILALFVFVHPWFIRPGRGWQAFVIPFMLIFIWGVWRVVSYDAATNNDVPGMFYIASAFFYSFIALGLYGIRCLIRRSQARRRASEKA